MTLHSSTQATDVVDKFFDPSSEVTDPILSTLLIVGPSGVGKTTLVQECKKISRVSFKQLSPLELSDEEAGIVERNISNAFNPVPYEPDTPSSHPKLHVVFIDDIHIWAPSHSTSPLHYRIIATLNDILHDMQSEDSQHVRFIATASSINAIHPSLVQKRTLNNVISLFALSLSERYSWSHDALLSLFPDVKDHKDLSDSAHKIASMTPGYVHADMMKLFSSLFRNVDSRKFPSSPAHLVQSSLLRDVSRSFTPLLLEQINPLLTSIVPREEKLFALHDQLAIIEQCLNAVFLDCSMDSKASIVDIDAFKGINALAGILIHGPTGCGKSTLLKKAVQALPLNMVNILPLDSASIVSSVIGQAERSISNIFRVARMIAPSVIIIDNIDVLAANRDQMHNDSSSPESFTRILSTLLVQIDGIRTESTNNHLPVLVIATTRDFNLIDPALLRPGRIDVHVRVSAPNVQERSEIFKHVLSVCDEEHDIDLLVKQSKGWVTSDVIAFAKEQVMS